MQILRVNFLRVLFVVVVAIFTTSVIPSSAYAEEVSANLNLLLGSKELYPDDWEPVDNQFEVGLRFDIKMESWPISIAIDTYGAIGIATESSVWDVTSETSELALGVRVYSEEDSNSAGFAGIGVAHIYAEEVWDDGLVEIADEDESWGLWIDAGVITYIGPFSLGAMARLSHATVDIFGKSREAGGGHLGLFAGIHF
ncbi:MAG: hypothetical protein KAT46_07700 [Deltaproteobacteria bacterium]|nr:hypothetical protein [Deltaproteobacteria bacterium]